eukprot:COSAG02_NODE_802_length_17030_cov_37.485500_17_plen_62_part_00
MMRWRCLGQSMMMRMMQVIRSRCGQLVVAVERLRRAPNQSQSKLLRRKDGWLAAKTYMRHT